jgi:hypothetical protein
VLADVQLDDLPRPMTTGAQPAEILPYSRAPLSQAPLDEHPIVGSDGAGNLPPPPPRRGMEYGASAYPPPGDYSGQYPPAEVLPGELPPGALPAGVVPPGVLPPGIPYAAMAGDYYGDPWTWQLLPLGLIYHSYLAGPKEPRMSSVWQHQTGAGGGPFWDFTVGGRIGLIRYGTPRGFRPDGWEIDIEGAAQPQLTLNHDRDMHSTDFRGGAVLTYGLDRFQAKFGYYHLSSHIGDEFFIKNPTFNRLNFSRDCLVLGIGYFLTDSIRLYGETAWAFYTDGGSEPWEFQFGAEYSPMAHPGWRGDPFAAINAHLRQEVNFGGSLVVQVGWQWLSAANGSRLRTGFQYFNGKNEQYQFYYDYVQQFGYGIWYDY